MARRLRRIVRFGLAVLLLCATPAGAVFFPGVEFPEPGQPKKDYWVNVPNELRKTLSKQVMGLTVNADYHYGTQDVVGNVPALPGARLVGDTEVNTYTIRPEIVLTNWLSAYAIGALHEGSSTASVPAYGVRDTKYSLDGWGVGAGVTAALGLPRYRPDWSDKLAFDPLFIVPDLNWTHNDFDDIENAVDIVNVTTRIGGALRTRFYNVGLYAGPMYQTATSDLTVRTSLSPTPVKIESEAKEAWSGVVGAFVGTWFAKDPDHVRRPTIMLTVEGGVGNRQGVLVSLRYEYDLLPQTRE